MSPSSFIPSLTQAQHRMTMKLGDNNILWRAQILPYLKGIKLLKFLDGSFPSSSPTIKINNKDVHNPKYQAWLDQDSLLSSLLNT